MLSEEMYNLLKKVPRYEETISYADLNKDDDKQIYHLICEAVYDAYDFLNKHGDTIKKSSFSLTEKGQAAIEEYEQSTHNQKMMKTSLHVAIIAAIAAVASVLATIASFIKMFA
ncbi:MAG: hypothetical protein II458_05795 [Oscillospiraceae bacterium]|nr:hypothetical protein [Oscillospiraceae bacterium]